MTNDLERGLRPSVGVRPKEALAARSTTRCAVGLVALFPRGHPGLSIEAMKSEPLATRVTGALRRSCRTMGSIS